MTSPQARSSGWRGGLDNKEYPPSEDTFFMAGWIAGERGERALDIGSGSGYLTKLLSENFGTVIGTDIDHDILAGQTYRTENLVCCNGADALGAKFDLIVCNLPYLATDHILDPATDGGPRGLEAPRRILDSAAPRLKRGGKLVYVTSSLSDYGSLLDYARGLGLETGIVARKKLFFEELLLVESLRG